MTLAYFFGEYGVEKVLAEHGSGPGGPVSMTSEDVHTSSDDSYDKK